MKIYLAGSWQRRKELQEYASALIQSGHQVTSRWLWSEIGGLGQTPDSVLCEWAQVDLEDVRTSECLILFTERHGVWTSGGRLVEFGVALERGLQLICIGRKENIFCYGSGILLFEQFQSALEHLTNNS